MQALLVQLDLRAKRVTRAQLVNKVSRVLLVRKVQQVLPVLLDQLDPLAQVEVRHHPVGVGLCCWMLMEMLLDTH
jgi:hypothetical protein